MSFTSIAMSEANTNKSVVSTAGSVISKGLTQNKDKEKEVNTNSIDKIKAETANNTLNGKLEAIRQQTKQKRISIEDKNVSENPIVGGGLNG